MRRIRRVRPAGLGIIALLVAGGLVGCGDDARTYQIGEGAPDRTGYELAYTEGGGAEGMGTATTPVEQWGFGCRQLFAGGRSGTSALLQQPCGENHQVFAVTGDFWARYRDAEDIAFVKYGFPVGRRGEWKQGWTQGFGRGGVFTTSFMQRPGEPLQTLSAPMLEYFLSFDDRDVRFGYPTGEMLLAHNRLCQQFEHAVVTATGAGDHFSFEVTPGGAVAGPARCS